MSVASGVDRAVEHVDVLIVGAGLSGIGAAHHIATKTPWLTFAILEGRDAIGGTWDLFRYPGVRSDSDMFTLGYGFRPWNGENSIADGASIRDYIRETAAEDGTDQRIRFGHKVRTAAWSSDDALWHVTAELVSTGESVELTCRFLYSCTGYYRYDRGHLPEFPGYDDFDGTIVHPQVWPDDLDYAGKRVVVIGSGATAVTLVPAMAETAGHVTMLQRSPTYIASAPAKNPLNRGGPNGRWARSGLRWALAIGGVAGYQFSRRRPETVRKLLRKGVEKRLPEGYDIDTHFTPAYDPWDQRMCMVPDGDLFTAISEGRASVVTDHIETFTPAGIRLASGEELEADVIVTATGLEMLFLGGIELTVDDEAVDPSTRLTYRGTMIEGVPNLAFAFGYTNASWPLKCELSCDYVTRVLTRMRETGLRQCTPVHSGTEVEPLPFVDLTSGYVQRSVQSFPKQGDAFPWQVHQNYLRDYRAMRLKGLEDDVLRLSNPTPIHTSATPAGPALTGSRPR